MDVLSSDEKIEAGEEVECAIDPERPQYLRRSGVEEGASVRSGIGDAQRFGNCPVFLASCTPKRRQPLRPSQRIVGGTDGTCR
jgi:hypothetical protein